MSRKGRTLRAAMAALAVLLAISSVLAYPRPGSVATRWELEFKPGNLRLYMDPGEGESEAYWYFTYKVTHRTGRDQVWAPTFVLFTDAGEILASGRGVPSRVAADIRELLANEFLEHQNEIIGDIYHGRDHAKEGLVVWPARIRSGGRGPRRFLDPLLQESPRLMIGARQAPAAHAIPRNSYLSASVSDATLTSTPGPMVVEIDTFWM